MGFPVDFYLVIFIIQLFYYGGGNLQKQKVTSASIRDRPSLSPTACASIQESKEK